MLIVYHLNHDKVSWEQFIEQEGFIYSPVRRSVGRPIKRQPKSSVVSPNQNQVPIPKPSQLEPLNRCHGKSSSASTKETRSSPRLVQIKATSSTPESKFIHKIYTRRQKLKGSQANKPSPQQSEDRDVNEQSPEDKKQTPQTQDTPSPSVSAKRKGKLVSTKNISV